MPTLKERIAKEIKHELRAIEKEYDPSDWDYCDLAAMNGEEAYNRGFYRAYQNIKSMLV